MRFAALLLCLASPAAALDLEFCWEGANGYLLDGRMTIDDAALSQPIITETDVIAFTIRGSHKGVPVGAWSLDQVTPTTSWNLNFDPGQMAFLTGGLSSGPFGQQWNANGAVNDCGSPGFGFNSGAGGQDVCINNTYMTDSIVPADTPLPVYPLGEGPPCGSAPMLSAVDPAKH